MYVINVTDKGALRPFFQSYISLHTRPHNELFFQRQSEKLLGNNFLFQPLKDLMRFFLPHANFAKTIIVYIFTGTSDYSTLAINHNQKISIRLKLRRIQYQDVLSSTSKLLTEIKIISFGFRCFGLLCS